MILPRQHSLSFPHCKTSRKNGHRLDNITLNRYAGLLSQCYDATEATPAAFSMSRFVTNMYPHCHIWQFLMKFIPSFCDQSALIIINPIIADQMVRLFLKSLQCFNSFPTCFHLSPFCRIFVYNDFNSKNSNVNHNPHTDRSHDTKGFPHAQCEHTYAAFPLNQEVATALSQ